MEQSIVKHQDKITGIISCFDRIFFKGYFPMSHAEGMEAFLRRKDVLLKELKAFASSCSASLRLEVQEKRIRPDARSSILIRPSEKNGKLARLLVPVCRVSRLKYSRMAVGWE
jgi:hypothetical protein